MASIGSCTSSNTRIRKRDGCCPLAIRSNEADALDSPCPNRVSSHGRCPAANRRQRRAERRQQRLRFPAQFVHRTRLHLQHLRSEPRTGVQSGPGVSASEHSRRRLGSSDVGKHNPERDSDLREPQASECRSARFHAPRSRNCHGHLQRANQQCGFVSSDREQLRDLYLRLDRRWRGHHHQCQQPALHRQFTRESRQPRDHLGHRPRRIAPETTALPRRRKSTCPIFPCPFMSVRSR